MKRLFATLALVGAGTSANAAPSALQIDGCHGSTVSFAHAYDIVEPWADNSRTVHHGTVRLSVLENGDPDQSGYFLLILGRPPVHDYEPGPRQCRVITFAGTLGFAAIDLANLVVLSDDPAGHLTFALPVETRGPDNTVKSRRLTVGFNVVNGNTGANFNEN